MDNQFDSKGGEQNVGQGDGAIGKQVNTTQEVRGNGNIFSATGNMTVNNGVSEELFAKYAGELAVTDSALASFFKILEEQQVPPGDLDAKLREIAKQYKELLRNWEAVQSTDPQAAKLKADAKQAIDAGDYAKAESLLEDIAKHYSLAAAEAHAENARLQRVQLRYAKAAAYWQKATALLPEDKKKERSLYLHETGYDLDRIAKYKEALPLYEQSLRITQEIGDKAGEGAPLSNIAGIHWAQGDYDKALPLLEQSVAIFREAGSKAEEGTLLNNIGEIYHARGDYPTALKYLEQSLRIRQGIGDKAGEGTTLNNIATIHHAKGDYTTALKYLEQNLVLFREIGDKAHEGATLSNIGALHHAKGDYDKALPLYEQSLVIRREIGDKAGEAVTSWNIGAMTYKKRKAESYMSRAVQLAEEIGHPKLKEWRKGLKRVRAKLRGR